MSSPPSTPEVAYLPIRVPSWRIVVWEEGRLLLRRHWWEFLAVFALLTVYFCWPRLLDFYPGDVNIGVMLGAPWGSIFVTGVIYLTLSGYLGIALWRDQLRGGREHSARLPVEPALAATLKVGVGALAVAGAALLSFYVTLLIWTLGPPRLETARFVMGFLPPADWLAWAVAMVNGFLVGSMIGILSRNPIRTALYISMVLAIVFGLCEFLPWDPLRLPLSPIMPPEGLLGGLGFMLWDGSGNALVPKTSAPLVWLPLLSTAVFFAARHAAHE